MQPGALLSAAVAGAARAPRPRRHAGPAQFLRQWQQRVGRAGDDLAGDIDDPLAPAARDGPELLECLPRPDPVPLRQHPDRLLHPDPDGQGAFQLADSDPQPPRLLMASSVTSGAVTRGNVTRGAVSGRVAARHAVTGHAIAACGRSGAGRLGS